MRCTCTPAEIGFDSRDCLVYGPGGLRDLQEERRRVWRDKHRIRARFRETLVRLQYRNFFKK